MAISDGSMTVSSSTPAGKMPATDAGSGTPLSFDLVGSASAHMSDGTHSSQDSLLQGPGTPKAPTMAAAAPSGRRVSVSYAVDIPALPVMTSHSTAGALPSALPLPMT